MTSANALPLNNLCVCKANDKKMSTLVECIEVKFCGSTLYSSLNFSIDRYALK